MLASKVIRPAWPKADKRPRKEPPEDDAIFFHKGQIKPGVVLINYGRLSTGTHWEVRTVYTHNLTPSGSYRRKQVPVAEKLGDDVELVCRETGEHRSTQFANLSYSAIWRLA